MRGQKLGKTKVAFCVRDMRIGGTESVLLRTLKALRKNKNLEFHVITYARIKEPIYIKWFENHPSIKIQSLYPCSWLGTNLSHFVLFRLPQHLMRDIYRWFKRTFINKKIFDNIDIFIDYYNFSFDKEFKKIKKPKISWWHSSSKIFIDGNYVRYLSRYDKLVVLTDKFVKQFVKRYPTLRNKIVKIFNPIDIKDVRDRAKIGLKPKSENYFVSVSRLSADKDVKSLVLAFNKFWLENKNPNVDLFIVGDGDQAKRSKQIAKSLPSSGKIIFTGSLENSFGFISGAKVNVLSSHSEGLPTAPIEAMALGILNIASDCPNGPREILLDGKAGILFDVGNIDQLAKAMSDVWNKKVDANKMIKVAYESLSRFNSDKIAKQIVRLLNQYK